MFRVPEITPTEAKEKLEQNNGFVIVDVRENKELIVASVKGAQHIRMGDIPRRINELPKQKEIGLLCHTGVRSGQVAVFLRQHGFNAINIQGGIDLWSRSVDSTVPRY